MNEAKNGKKKEIVCGPCEIISLKKKQKKNRIVRYACVRLSQLIHVFLLLKYKAI